MVEAIRRDVQFVLPDFPEPRILTEDNQAAEALERKRGLLFRILRPKRDGQLFADIKMIETGFKAGSDRANRYFYNTQRGRLFIDATPEDISAVIQMRHKANDKNKRAK